MQHTVRCISFPSFPGSGNGPISGTAEPSDPPGGVKIRTHFLGTACGLVFGPPPLRFSPPARISVAISALGILPARRDIKMTSGGAGDHLSSSGRPTAVEVVPGIADARPSFSLLSDSEPINYKTDTYSKCRWRTGEDGWSLIPHINPEWKVVDRPEEFCDCAIQWMYGDKLEGKFAWVPFDKGISEEMEYARRKKADVFEKEWGCPCEDQTHDYQEFRWKIDFKRLRIYFMEKKLLCPIKRMLVPWDEE